MKTNMRASNIVILVIFLMLVGCKTSNDATISLPQKTLTAKPSPTLTQKPTAFFLPSPTPYPTLPSSKALQLYEAIQNENCKLPCFLGVVPGQTPIQEAREIMEGLGGSYLGEYIRKKDEALSHTFVFEIGNQQSGELLITHSVTLLTNNEIVQVIIVSAGTLVPEASTEAIETFRTYWQRYSARGIFNQLSEPERLSVNSINNDRQKGSFLIILYSEENIVVNIYGTGKENNLCPDNEATYLSIDMYLSYPNATVSINDSNAVSLTNQEIYPPIEDVYDATTKEFYDGVLLNPSICWELKENLDN